MVTARELSLEEIKEIRANIPEDMAIVGISNDFLDILNSSFNKLKEKNNKQLANLKELCSLTADSDRAFAEGGGGGTPFGHERPP